VRIPDQIKKVAHALQGGAVVGEIACMQARSGIIPGETVYDFVVHVKRDVQAIPILNDEQLLLDLRLGRPFMAMDIIENAGIGYQKIVDAVWNLDFVNPLELTL
jgi:hypothetical protein